MPIVGLTDNIAPTFPEIGKLRKGGKRKGNGPGPDLEWFRFTSDRPEVEAAFYAAYPDKPTRVNVVLPHDTADECFTVWQEEWGASITLKHRCDGVHVVRRWNGEKGEYEDFPEGKGPFCPYTIPPAEGGKFRTKETPGCQITGRLNVVIPELVAAGYVGYVTVLTGAKNDVLSILSILAKMEEERGKRGATLAWMSFTLERVKQEISSPAWEGDEPDRRHKVTKSLLKLTPSEEWVRAQVEIARNTYRVLPAPEEAEATLAEGRALLHGDVEDGEWDDGGEPGESVEPSQQTRDSDSGPESQVRAKWLEYYNRKHAEAQELGPDVLPLEEFTLERDENNNVITPTAKLVDIATALGDAVKRGKLIARWEELVTEGKALGLEVLGIELTGDDEADKLEFARRGKMLKAEIAAAKAEAEIAAAKDEVEGKGTEQ